MLLDFLWLQRFFSTTLRVGMRERRRADKGKTPKMSTFKGENAKMVIMLNIHNPFSPGERPIRVQLIIIFGGLAFYLFIYFKSVIQQPFITWLFFFLIRHCMLIHW